MWNKGAIRGQKRDIPVFSLKGQRYKDVSDYLADQNIADPCEISK